MTPAWQRNNMPPPAAVWQQHTVQILQVSSPHAACAGQAQQHIFPLPKLPITAFCAQHRQMGHKPLANKCFTRTGGQVLRYGNGTNRRTDTRLAALLYALYNRSGILRTVIQPLWQLFCPMIFKIRLLEHDSQHCNNNQTDMRMKI